MGKRLGEFHAVWYEVKFSTVLIPKIEEFRDPQGAQAAVRGAERRDCACCLPGDNGPDQGQALAAADSWPPGNT